MTPWEVVKLIADIILKATKKNALWLDLKLEIINVTEWWMIITPPLVFDFWMILFRQNRHNEKYNYENFRCQGKFKPVIPRAGSRPWDRVRGGGGLLGGGGWSSRKWDEGGGRRSLKNFFRPFGPQFGLKIRGAPGPRAPPLDLPLIPTNRTLNLAIRCFSSAANPDPEQA